MRLLLQLCIMPLPWVIRRSIYKLLFEADFATGSYIGRSLLMNVGAITMAEGSRIGHFNMIRNLDHLSLGKGAIIGTFNWIAGLRTGSGVRFFSGFPGRRSVLELGDQSAIVARHIIDCTDAVTIGEFTTVAGHRSQLITHSIDLDSNQQSCAPIAIGSYCFLGTAVVIVKNSVLPDHSALGAGSVVTRKLEEPWSFYAGNPACKIKDLSKDAKYFSRTRGFVS